MDIDKRIKITFLKYGGILGVLYLTFTIASYYFITSGTQSPVLFIAAPIIFRLVIPLLLTLFLCYTGRKQIGGLWTFKQATTGIFVMLFIAFLIQFVGKDIIFDRYIEPNGIEKIQNAAISAKTVNLKQKGYDQKTIDKNIGEMKKDLASQTNVMTPGSIISEVVFSTLFIFLFALIFASLFRNAEYISASKIKQ
jgi:hypothetical protein